MANWDGNMSERPNKRAKMATYDSNMNLSGKQIRKLAESIVATKMKAIAGIYMEIESEMVENLWITHKGNAIDFNRAVLTEWKNINPGDNQVQVSFGKDLLIMRQLFSTTCHHIFLL